VSGVIAQAFNGHNVSQYVKAMLPQLLQTLIQGSSINSDLATKISLPSISKSTVVTSE
jgi:hypothetical protein